MGARRAPAAPAGDVKTCLFAGPTLFGESIPAGVSCFGPVSLGSVFRAFESGYRRIGIVDGFFGNTPSVWHKEILYAISKGAEVAGAASMGALRAAELWQFGMIGLGRIFRLFRSGSWTDDDEVAVVHATEELGFQPLSDAMANVRFTLRRLRQYGVTDRAVERDLIGRMKARHFSERTREELCRQSAQVLGRSAALRFMAAFEREYIDVKRRDARALVQYLIDQPSARMPRARPVFLATAHWREQFEDQIEDVPPLH
jgi:hypothetical protein